MVDEPQDAQNASTEVPRDTATRRSLWAALGVSMIIVIVVLVLLLLRGLGGGQSQASTGSGGKVIVPVEGRAIQQGVISIWLEPGTKPATVLAAAGLGVGSVVDLGGERFVVSVPAGSESSAIKKLHSVGGVVDAGNVFVEDAAK